MQMGDTALLVATASEHEPCLQLLLDAGADLKARNNVRPSRVIRRQPCSHVLASRSVRCCPAAMPGQNVDGSDTPVHLP